MKLTTHCLRIAAILVLATRVATAHAAGWIVEGRVVAISDGDTITVLDEAKAQHKVRIASIDARERNQAFGTASRESLSRLAFKYPQQRALRQRLSPPLHPGR